MFGDQSSAQPAALLWDLLGIYSNFDSVTAFALFLAGILQGKPPC